MGHDLVHGQAQQGSGSPFSAYGLGEMVGPTQVSQALMGGAGVALVDPYSVIRMNPASYTSMVRPAFETGFVGRFLRFDTEEVGQTGRRSNLLGMSLGVPFGNGKWGMALGLNPESQVGYTISDVGQLPGGGGDVTFRYSGTGGLNRAFMGMGRVLHQHRDSLGNGSKLSFGANLNYLFGNIEEARRAFYPSNQSFYNTAVVSTLVLRDPSFNVGVQFQGDLVKRKRLEDDPWHYLIGVAAELPSRLGARRTETVYSFAQGGSGLEFPVDTISFLEGARGSVSLPVQLSIGATLFNTRWAVSLEHRRRDWQQTTFDLEGVDISDQLGLASTTILGGSYRPAGQDRGNFWQRSIYRAGLRYTNDYLVVAGNQLSEIGMSFGLSLPVMGSTTRSRISLGTEVGEQGNTANGSIRERYAAVFIGLTVTPDRREQWFKKRRIE